jgi:hypothetical protein
MNPETQDITTPPLVTRRPIWQWIGGESLAISIVIHLALLVLAVFWVLQVIPHETEKDIPFAPNSGGSSASTQVQQKARQAQISRPNLARVVADGAVSHFALPEPEALSVMASMGGLSSDSLASGLGGGGKGGKAGSGIGNGLFPGMSSGTGTKNPFGMLQMNKNALVGTFYDLKQTRDRKPTDLTDTQVREEIRDIVKKGLREQDLKKYYQASRTLYQTKFLIPTMRADIAPAAFECQNEVEPKRWVIVYRGAVQAPKSGKFRFVGAGDDVLVVRFDNRPVFDFGYTVVGIMGHPRGAAGGLKGSDLEKAVRKNTPMSFPFETYKYEKTPSYNGALGGLAIGPTFEVKAGASYPIEILIAEIPGGYFSSALLIEEVGERYPKLENGSPLLPLFQLDGMTPEVKSQDEAPPFAKDGPIWNFSRSGMRIGI